jgi:hypothetical protein
MQGLQHHPYLSKAGLGSGTELAFSKTIWYTGWGTEDNRGHSGEKEWGRQRLSTLPKQTREVHSMYLLGQWPAERSRDSPVCIGET